MHIARSDVEHVEKLIVEQKQLIERATGTGLDG